jgi:hypothetical protein
MGLIATGEQEEMLYSILIEMKSSVLTEPYFVGSQLIMLRNVSSLLQNRSFIKSL